MADVVDLDEFIEDGWKFRFRGREFTVPEVEWQEYLELVQLQSRIEAAAVAGDTTPVDGDQWWELAPRVLGPVLDELFEVGAKGPTITLLARSAYFFQLGDRAAANAFLLSSSGKAETPNPEGSPGSTSTTPTGSTSSASETETQLPASSTATRSPTKSSGHSRSTKVAAPTEPAAV